MKNLSSIHFHWSQSPFLLKWGLIFSQINTEIFLPLLFETKKNSSFKLRRPSRPKLSFSYIKSVPLSCCWSKFWWSGWVKKGEFTIFMGGYNNRNIILKQELWCERWIANSQIAISILLDLIRRRPGKRGLVGPSSKWYCVPYITASKQNYIFPLSITLHNSE